jgi:hypothetical protein
MMRKAISLLALPLVLIVVAPAPSAAAAECNLPRPAPSCFGIESVDAFVSTTQAGAHPDLTLDVEVAQDPTSEPNVFGLKSPYAATRDIRFDLPPGLIGDPNVLGVPQQCVVQELLSFQEPNGGCPNGSQVGISTIATYGLQRQFPEPVYLMQPPGGDVVARLGVIAGIYPTFIDIRVRSEGNYGLQAEVENAAPTAKLVGLETTLWGVPAAKSHDTERCTLSEAFLENCLISPSRPPGSRPLPFLTNPTRCGVPLPVSVSASNWVEPDRFDKKTAQLHEMTECNRLPFGPSLTATPTTSHTSQPTGLAMTIRLPRSSGVEVLEPSQIRDIRIDLPQGVRINPGSAEGLGVCSVEDVRFGERVSAECPNDSKLASAEFEVGGLPRRMKGAIYLREPEPGHLFRIWIVADDLGAHVKLRGELELDESTGQIKSVVLENPQVPLREVQLLFKSGFRAPLMTPSSCGEYLTHFEFTPWAGGPPFIGHAPMQIDGGCGRSGFSPKFVAGSTEASGGAHSPFLFTVNREDSEENISGFTLTLPRGLAATFSGIAHCEGAAAETGACPPSSQIGTTTVADGVGPNPLWVPQPGKDPTAIYLGGPYKGAPFSIVAVVPAQAGPFDLGDEVVRSAVRVDPVTAQATTETDPLPQFIEGIPIIYQTVHVDLGRPGFTLNPTSCARKETSMRLTSAGGKVAASSFPYRATDCSALPFKPKLSIRLFGGTRRAAHPRLVSVVKMPAGDANIAGAQVTLPPAEFVDNEHFNNICTRVDFAAHRCPAGSVYGRAVALTPLLDFPLEGPVYLRSAPESKSGLPDLVAALTGPPSMPIEIDVVGHVDSVKGALRATFDSVPDAPVSKFTLQMQGGKKGLIQNSENLCDASQRAVAKFTAQNGKIDTFHPRVRNSCKKKAR